MDSCLLFRVTDFMEPEGIAWTEQDGTVELESPAPWFRWVSSREFEACSAPLRDFMKPATNEALMLCLYLLVPGALKDEERALLAKLDPRIPDHDVATARYMLTDEQRASLVATHFQVSDVTMLEDGGSL